MYISDKSLILQPENQLSLMNATVAHIRQTLRACYAPQEAAWLSRIICCDIFGQSVTDYYAGKDMTLSSNEEQELKDILSRLLKFEPIQYIQGECSFLGRKILVSSGVLIPRPETEELVEIILKELPPQAQVLDIGTGSGCIAITLSKELPQTQVTAWDISEDALHIAQANNQALKASVRFERQDVLTYRPSREACYDAIVSNPPYVTASEKKDMERNVLDWEPATALFVPDNDPLRFYRHIAQLAQILLKAKGKLYFEINQAFGPDTVALLDGMGYKDAVILKDLSGNDRFVIAEK